MKLRKCLFPAVVFSVGIAFAVAEEPADEDTFRETTYTYDNSIAPEGSNAYTLSFYKAAGNNADDMTLIEYSGIGGTESGRNGENESLRIFDLSTHFSDSISEEIGFVARGDRKKPLVFSDVISEAPIRSQSAGNETYSMLSFNKKAFTNANGWGQIISGESNLNDSEEENVLVFFSSIVTIPFAILSFSLCIGFLLIMFTSTGKKTDV